MRRPKKATSGIVFLAIGSVIAAALLITQWLRNLEHDARIERGRALASVRCATCHLEPPPDILPKRSWETTLGYMGLRLGMDETERVSGRSTAVQDYVASRREMLERENAIPAAPLLDESDWEALRYYYMETSPSSPLPQAGKPELHWELPRFQVFRSSYRVPQAVTTLVHIREETSEVYIGDSASRTLTVLDGDGRIRVAPRRFRPGITPVDVEFVGDTAYLASIGDLMAISASEEKPAFISALGLVDGSIADANATLLFGDLYRMADVEVADLNGDGALDFIVCGFGAVSGGISWFESQRGGGYAERVLMDRPGAVRAQTHDFNGDGFLDIAALLSDAREGFYILHGGANEFRAWPIFETHPAYGHTYFELQDFNDDGLMDILAVNGDNVDSDPYNTLKNYHGIRIYLNRRDLRFEEAYFYPMYGAFGARAADFDNDGDLDIAAISFYPDFTAERWESFAYLRNEGDLTFSAHTSEELTSGRWITMDAGDVDGDGDVDVVLGGGYVQTGMFAHMDVYEGWAERGPAVLVLENILQ
jgi:hypothetical protein